MILDFEQVRRILPQKYPFIMVDKVTELEPGKRISAIKNLSGNEAIFQGHFADRAVFPGVYIIEAMGQAGILLWSEGDPLMAKDKICYLTSVKVRFLNPVVPGDQLILEAEFSKKMENAGIINVRAKVGDKLIARGELVMVAVRAS
jgi:3-hydroxyacyl-[acyl-carrier-protein] dehydratase